MPKKQCTTCGQRLSPGRDQCPCPSPDPPDNETVHEAFRRARLKREAHVSQRIKAVEDACRLLHAYAAVSTELLPPAQTAVEEALTTIRNLLLPQPQLPKVPRGRRPDFESHEAFLAALEDGLKRFPHSKEFTQANLASLVRAKTPEGQEHGLSVRAFTDNLALFRVNWKNLKRQYKNSKKSGG